ncbi:MAG: aminomethyl-transferring glycine dehydrogenase subunit GcvPA [Chloroflexota bacterium]
MAFTPHTPTEREQMLAAIGVADAGELFADIPPGVRFPTLDVPPPLTEQQTVDKMAALARQNRHVGELACFVGAGAYNHYIPSVVPHIMGRSEFYTAYTPYQAEMAQGTLQVMFEFQSLVCDLFQMDVSNSSVYDGASAVAEAVLMALRVTRRERVVVAGAVNPEYRAVLASYVDGRDVQVSTSAVSLEHGTLSTASPVTLIDESTACCVIQQPDFFGTVQDLSEIVARCREVGALLVYAIADPVSLGVLKTPGAWGADIAIAEGQGLGLPLSYGGPWVGMMACKQEHVRQLPGRIVGQTTDGNGNRGFVLTLQAREQHIRREKATSNICTSQTLLALGTTVYLAAMGPGGLRQAAALSHKNVRALASRVRDVPGFRVLNPGPVFNEITIECPIEGDEARRTLVSSGVLAGFPLGRDYPGLERCLVLCCTERNTPEEIERLAQGLRELGRTA